MPRLLLALVMLSIAAPWLSGSITAIATGEDVEPTLARFLARPDEPLEQYRAIRHLEAQNARFNRRGSLDAVTSLNTDGRFSFTVVHEEGSEYIRTKVLRPLLESEEKLFATTDPSSAALTSRNYELKEPAPAEPGVVRLFAKPRRKEVSLVEGFVFVTRDDSDLVRVEGRLAKNPSFWITSVDVVRRYNRLAGIRVPVRLDSTAQVRIAGTSTLTVTYEYEMVNGITVR